MRRDKNSPLGVRSYSWGQLSKHADEKRTRSLLNSVNQAPDVFMAISAMINVFSSRCLVGILSGHLSLKITTSYDEENSSSRSKFRPLIYIEKETSFCTVHDVVIHYHAVQRMKAVPEIIVRRGSHQFYGLSK